jgi:hypothetical protein
MAFLLSGCFGRDDSEVEQLKAQLSAATVQVQRAKREAVRVHAERMPRAAPAVTDPR